MEKFRKGYHLSSNKRRKSEEQNRLNERVLTEDEFRFALFSDIAYAAEWKIEDQSTPMERLNKAKDMHSEKYQHLGLDDYEIVEANESMFAAINKKKRKAVISVRGSNFYNIKDLYNVLNIASNGLLPHNKQVKVDKFIQKFRKKYSNYDLTLTGHSAGGYHTEYNAVKTGLKCESFNSGTPVFPGDLDAHSHIKSHVINLDLIAIRALPGERIPWEREVNIGRHRIENFIRKYDRQQKELTGIDYEANKKPEEPISVKEQVDDKSKRVVKDALEEVGQKIEKEI